MNTPIEIKKAGVDDIQTIRSLAYAIWPLTYGPILPEGQVEFMLALIYSEESLTKQITIDGHRFFIAYLDGKPVGFAAWSYTPEPGVFKLQKLYVDTQIHGRGLGKALLERVIRNLPAADSDERTLILNVNKLNPALSFYERMGFQIMREVVLEIGNGYVMDDYIMEKKIAQENAN
jgi:ribosomal protein S18 acetylase RimI-like enzyme